MELKIRHLSRHVLNQLIFLGQIEQVEQGIPAPKLVTMDVGGLTDDREASTPQYNQIYRNDLWQFVTPSCTKIRGLFGIDIHSIGKVP